MLYESKNESERCSQQAHDIVLAYRKCYLYVANVGLISKERSMPAGLKFEKQIFRVKPGTPLSMTHWLQKRKTNNLASNTNGEVTFRLINILLHIRKNLLGIV